MSLFPLKKFSFAIYDIWQFWKLLEDFQENSLGVIISDEIAAIN